jgi:hypothetical protein
MNSPSPPPSALHETWLACQHLTPPPFPLPCSQGLSSKAATAEDLQRLVQQLMATNRKQLDSAAAMSGKMHGKTILLDNPAAQLSATKALRARAARSGPRMRRLHRQLFPASPAVRWVGEGWGAGSSSRTASSGGTAHVRCALLALLAAAVWRLTASMACLAACASHSTGVPCSMC